MTDSPKNTFMEAAAMEAVPFICLSMIIKNESRVIARLLESAYRFIDCFCICDTGSDDATVEIVENFMRERGVPGRVIHEPFRDFEYNRNFALRAAEATTVAAQGSFHATEATTVAASGRAPTHILLLDADMVFWGAGSDSGGRVPTADEIATFRDVLAEGAHEAFYVFQGSDKFFYKNVRVVRTGLGIHYKSVTHEYICTPEGARYHTFPRAQVFIHDVGDGGSKHNKFERDIRLLTADLEKNPTNVRSWFYLGNSYHDSGNLEKAIEAYTRRIELGGWIEEIFYSHYRIGQCYKRLGRPRDAIVAWMDAYQSFPQRIEPLYEIVHYYRCAGQNNLAYMFYTVADKVRRAHPRPDFLFVNYEIYTWKLDYEMSIIGYYCNTDNYSLTALSHAVLDRPAGDVESYIVQNVLSNYKFYAARATVAPPKGNLLKVLADVTEQSRKKVDEILARRGAESDKEEFFSSTPSFCMSSSSSGADEIILNVRFVNYRIGERGEYINQEKIETINIVSVLTRCSASFAGSTAAAAAAIATFGRVAAHYSINNYFFESGGVGGQDNWVLSRAPDVMPHDPTKDNVYVGIEDVRLHASRENGLCLYNGNRGLGQSHIIVETGVVDLRNVVGSASALSGFITLPDKQKDVEKNWVMFEPASAQQKRQAQNATSAQKQAEQQKQQNIKYVYGWSPFIIGDGKKISSVTTEHIFCETHRIETPPFFRHLRGSTNGISVSSDTSDDEIWFMTHVVSYEDRRFYYHVVVVIDAQTFRVKRYTRMFTFEGAPVEYCLGFLYFPASSLHSRGEDATFLVGYSVLDRETKYVFVKREFFENLMINCD